MTDEGSVIELYNETNLTLPLQESLMDKVATAIAQEEGRVFTFVEVVFVDEQEIVRINKEHLERDYITDIISFRYDDPDRDPGIEGTLYCCAPRIQEQAREHNEPADREFLRIVIHGLLHLAGYNDQTESEKQVMTTKENTFLDVAGL